MTLLEIKTAAAHYLQLGVADLTVNSQDLGLIALNNARQWAELHNDFEFSRKLVTVTVNSLTGGDLADAVLYEDVAAADTATVTGTLTPDATGTYNRFSDFNNRPFFVRSDAAYILFWNEGYWQLTTPANFAVAVDTAGLVNDSWRRESGVIVPDLTLTAGSGYTGSASVTTAVATPVSVKSVIDVGTFDDNGNFRPVEWSTVSESLERFRSDNRRGGVRYPSDGDVDRSPAGRSRFNFSGDRIHFFPKDETRDEDFTLAMEVYAFNDDWVAGDLSATVAPWTTLGSQYLLYQSVVFLNERVKEFVPRTEGNLPPPTELANAGLEALKAWDSYKYEQFRRHGR